MGFEYITPTMPDNCTFRISPSKIGSFFSQPVNWYKSEILKEVQFTASTSTVLGSIVHYCAECYALNREVTRKEIDEYILSSARSQPVTSDPIMVQAIKDSYPEMAMRLVNDYIKKNKPTEVEQQIYAPVLDDIYVGGSCDNLTCSKEEYYCDNIAFEALSRLKDEK